MSIDQNVTSNRKDEWYRNFGSRLETPQSYCKPTYEEESTNHQEDN